MYSPSSLEEERLSWRSVVYYNIARPVRRILDALDANTDGEDDEGSGSEAVTGTPDTFGKFASSSSHFESTSLDQASSSFHAPSVKSDSDAQIASLRSRLATLVAAESSLAYYLSGGVSVAGSGKGNVFVRSGWQARSFVSFGKSKNRGDFNGRSSFTGQRSSLENNPSRASNRDSVKSQDPDALISSIGAVVDATKDDVRELWEHPAVKRLRDKRKLRLEEWAEL